MIPIDIIHFTWDHHLTIDSAHDSPSIHQQLLSPSTGLPQPAQLAAVLDPALPSSPSRSNSAPRVKDEVVKDEVSGNAIRGLRLV